MHLVCYLLHFPFSRSTCCGCGRKHGLCVANVIFMYFTLFLYCSSLSSLRNHLIYQPIWIVIWELIFELTHGWVEPFDLSSLKKLFPQEEQYFFLDVHLDLITLLNVLVHAWISLSWIFKCAIWNSRRKMSMNAQV